MKVTVIGRTVQKNSDQNNLDLSSYLKPDNILNSAKIVAGKAAGICYMPDDYLSEGMQDCSKAIKRSEFNAKSGHYSVYEHFTVNMLIECPKIIAMILNSMGLYATSEKSARYTKMNHNSLLGASLYNKWKSIFIELIQNEKIAELKTENEIEKLAMENARYLTSVFTYTTMEYSIPFNRAILMCEWLDEFTSNISSCIETNIEPIISNINFYNRLASNCSELSELIRDSLGLDKNNPVLVDHKNIGINMFNFLSYVNKLNPLKNDLNNIYETWYNDNSTKIVQKTIGNENQYESYYKASFAEFAQAQRHRTLDYKVELCNDCYIPKMLEKDEYYKYKKMWIEDFEKLVENGETPQCTLLEVFETGRIEDFILKCKERLCNRAQLEICEIAANQIRDLANTSYNLLSHFSRVLISEFVSYPDINAFAFNPVIFSPKNRCKCVDYTCKEPCKCACINPKDRII